MNVFYIRLSASYSGSEISRLIQAARDVLGEEADTSYSLIMSATEIAEQHPTGRRQCLCHGGFSSIVKLPVEYDNLDGKDYLNFLNEVQQVRTKVREELDRWEAGDAGEFGELFGDDDTEVNTIIKRDDGLFQVKVQTDRAIRWERERATQRTPFPGCRRMIWGRAGMHEFEEDHGAIDWAIAFVRSGR